MELIQRIETLESDWLDPRPEQARSHPPLLLNLVRFGFGTLGRLFPKAAARYAYRLFTTPRTRARHQVSDPILEKARIFEFLYGKQLLKGYEWGKGDRVILMVHGWESRGTALRSFVPALLEKGFRVVAFDGPAHGNSAGKRTSLPHFAGAVRAVLHQVGPVHGILTHSFGGAATVYALSVLEPDFAVQKLVQIAVPGSILTMSESAAKTMGLSERTRQYFKALLDQKAGRPIETLELPDLFAHIQVDEALIVHDRDDKVVPFRSAKAIVDRWDHAHLLVTEGYGHFRLMKNPDLIRAVAEFYGS